MLKYIALLDENQRFLRACRGLPVDATPVWFMRQAGRYMPEYRALRKAHSILELAKTPALACEVTLQPVRKFPVDAAILFADILLPVESLGLRLSFNPAPTILNPVRTDRDVARLSGASAADELGYVYEAVRLIRRELNGKVPLIGFAGAPYTVASYMVEGGPSDHYQTVKAMMSDRPDLWDRLMRTVRRVTARYLVSQVKAGAQAVQLFDSWIGSLTPQQYRRHVRPHSEWVLAEVAKTGVPTISFGTGTAGFLEDFAVAGGDVIGVDWRIDLDVARKRLGERPVQGNLDPVLMFSGRKPLRAAIKDVLSRNQRRRGHIFNLGHGLLPGTPVENVEFVASCVHELTAK